MSEYIYGSSLQAAKSKANYLFEGDFRRKPNQNLSGASRRYATNALIQEAAEQRISRECLQKKRIAALKIQSMWRCYKSRLILGNEMRQQLDHSLGSRDQSLLESESIFQSIISRFLVYFNSKVDGARLSCIISIILKEKDKFEYLVSLNREIWIGKLIKLLKYNMNQLKYSKLDSADDFQLFELLTRNNYLLSKHQLVLLWLSLVKDNFYILAREILDKQMNADSLGQMCRIILELVRRSLDLSLDGASNARNVIINSFFTQFLKGPLNKRLLDLYYQHLILVKPAYLEAKNIISTFQDITINSSDSNKDVFWPFVNQKCNNDSLKKIEQSVWFTLIYVKTIHQQIRILQETDLVDYLTILGQQLHPLEHITKVSILTSFDDDEDDCDDEELYGDFRMILTAKLNEHYTDINQAISTTLNLINDIVHIEALKPIISSNNQYTCQARNVLIRLCNLMLFHEPLAIFNCRLLYTSAFNREFLRSLWQSILNTSIQGNFIPQTPIYKLISDGSKIDDSLWSNILPQINLFCSLYSHLLPTIEDEDFHSQEVEIYNGGNDDDTLSNDKGKRAFFIRQELIQICTIIRDLCVGIIDSIYRDNGIVVNNSYSRTDNLESNTESIVKSQVLSFEVKTCFKLLVKLLRQLYTKERRSRFCPDGMWICQSLSIPSNKPIDFQTLSSQNIRSFYKDAKSSNKTTHHRITASNSELKTILLLQEIPFVISFNTRICIFHQLLHKERMQYLTDRYYFGMPGSAISIHIRRNFIYEDAFDKLSVENVPNLKLPLRVSLTNAAGLEEDGVDGGGLRKEFMIDLLSTGFNPMRGFFKSTTNHLLYPNPSANVIFASLPEGYETHYEFLGRMLGKAIFEKVIVDLPLADFFLAKLLANKHLSDLDLHNLNSLDPVLYKNLVYLKNYRDDVSVLNLDFTIANNDLGENEVVELKPGGREILVTKDNKIEYVHLVADYRLNRQIRAQCASFKRGLACLIDLNWLRMFDPQELRILISGSPSSIDIDDWRKHTDYIDGYTDDCETIKTFWTVVSKLNEDEKRKLLKFATSSPLPPLLGFRELVPPFVIAPTEETRLPSASTCMNMLKLPNCSNEEVLKSKILYAINSNSGFELS